MDLKNLIKLYSENGCNKVYIKKLAPNDNSKNQVYLGGNFDVLNVLPIKEIFSDNEGDWKRTRFKTKIEFGWVTNDGIYNPAPDAQLILYPKYPEVRFSGFLKNSKNAPSELMASRIPDRLLFLGVTNHGRILGYVTSPDSELANEVNAINNPEMAGIFMVLTISQNNIINDSRLLLLSELKRIYNLGWLNSIRLDSERNILPCNSSNCGGYTLEAELGITPNGFSEPDYLGWEVKQYGVKGFNKIDSSVITLMTPEPTHGYYVDFGVEQFIRTYGYADKKGREARLNFGGIHKNNTITRATNLKTVLVGYDIDSNKITDSTGYIGLIDNNDCIAASWSFTSLLKHWNTKHANACYVPSLNRKTDGDVYKQQYQFGNKILLGSGTDFSLFLQQFSNGNIVYDPGIKLELEIEGQRKQNIKRRSQFRIRSSNLVSLYRNNEIVNLDSI